MKTFKCLLIILFIFIDLSVFGQKNNDLSNETIVEMYSKGLPASIIATRLSSSANTFDISAEALIKFTENKLPDDLINAIVDAALDSTRHVVEPGSKNNALSNESIINMYNRGISPSIITLQINKAANTFDVSTDALIKLTENKMPEDLINAIIEAAGDLNRHLVINDLNNPNDMPKSAIYSTFKTEDTLNLNSNSSYNAQDSSQNFNNNQTEKANEENKSLTTHKGHFYNKISALNYYERLIVNSDHNFSSKQKLCYRSMKDKVVKYALFGKMGINKDDEWVYKTILFC